MKNSSPILRQFPISYEPLRQGNRNDRFASVIPVRSPAVPDVNNQQQLVPDNLTAPRSIELVQRQIELSSIAFTHNCINPSPLASIITDLIGTIGTYVSAAAYNALAIYNACVESITCKLDYASIIPQICTSLSLKAVQFFTSSVIALALRFSGRDIGGPTDGANPAVFSAFLMCAGISRFSAQLIALSRINKLSLLGPGLEDIPIQFPPFLGKLVTASLIPHRNLALSIPINSLTDDESRNVVAKMVIDASVDKELLLCSAEGWSDLLFTIINQIEPTAAQFYKHLFSLWVLNNGIISDSTLRRTFPDLTQEGLDITFEALKQLRFSIFKLTCGIDCAQNWNEFIHLFNKWMIECEMPSQELTIKEVISGKYNFDNSWALLSFIADKDNIMVADGISNPYCAILADLFKIKVFAPSTLATLDWFMNHYWKVTTVDSSVLNASSYWSELMIGLNSDFSQTFTWNPLQVDEGTSDFLTLLSSADERSNVLLDHPQGAADLFFNSPFINVELEEFQNDTIQFVQFPDSFITTGGEISGDYNYDINAMNELTESLANLRSKKSNDKLPTIGIPQSSIAPTTFDWQRELAAAGYIGEIHFPMTEIEEIKHISLIESIEQDSTLEIIDGVHCANKTISKEKTTSEINKRLALLDLDNELGRSPTKPKTPLCIGLDMCTGKTTLASKYKHIFKDIDEIGLPDIKQKIIDELTKKESINYDLINRIRSNSVDNYLSLESSKTRILLIHDSTQFRYCKKTYHYLGQIALTSECFYRNALKRFKQLTNNEDKINFIKCLRYNRLNNRANKIFVSHRRLLNILYKLII